MAETVAELVRSSEEGNAALMRGDIGDYANSFLSPTTSC